MVNVSRTRNYGFYVEKNMESNVRHYLFDACNYCTLYKRQWYFSFPNAGEGGGELQLVYFYVNRFAVCREFNIVRFTKLAQKA